MEQKEPVLVLYDREEEYARLFSEYLKRQKELPWQIHTYTRAEELLAGEKSGEVTMLVVAESSCEEALNTLQPTCQAILNESGTLRFHQFPKLYIFAAGIPGSGTGVEGTVGVVCRDDGDTDAAVMCGI